MIIDVSKVRKSARPVTRVFIHCDAYGRKDKKGLEWENFINSIHKNNGWSVSIDAQGSPTHIGYHFGIDYEGTLLSFRNVDRDPVAQAYHNKNTLAVVVAGLIKENFTQIQFDRLNSLLDEIEKYHDVTFHGHCEVSDKTCPVFDYKLICGIDKFGKRTLKRLKSGQILNKFIDLSMTSRGDDVKLAQSKLKITEDGIFGQETYKAVREFQRKVGLFETGVINKETWMRLLSS